MLICIRFFTLFERKILGYLQLRKGPNKVSFIGVFQPFSDAIKLFFKESIIPSLSNFYVFFFSCIFIFVFSLILWGLYIRKSIIIVVEVGVLFFLCISSVRVYTTLISG